MIVPSLSRACHACKRAKRKCQVQLPKCERCDQKGLDCLYDLEPLNRVNAQREQSISSTPKQPPRQGYRIFDDVAAAREAAAVSIASGMSELTLLVDNGSSAEFITQLYTDMKLFEAGQTTSYLHQQVIAWGKMSSNSSRDGERGSLDVDVEKYAVIIDLILAAANHVDSTVRTSFCAAKQSSQGPELTSDLDELLCWAQRLWSEGPFDFNHGSPWHAWLVAESARRTISMLYMVHAFVFWTLNGYVQYRPFLESLPFDPRSWLWEAETEAQWTSIIEDRFAGETICLSSWREFTEEITKAPIPRVEFDGHFQRLLLRMFYGMKASSESDRT